VPDAKVRELVLGFEAALGLRFRVRRGRRIRFERLQSLGRR
jgi:hypothetical protein